MVLLLLRRKGKNYGALNQSQILALPLHEPYPGGRSGRGHRPGSAGVLIFDEQATASGTIKKLGDFVVSEGKTSHTMSVDPNTHVLYFAVQNAENKPVLRIMEYTSA